MARGKCFIVLPLPHNFTERLWEVAKRREVRDGGGDEEEREGSGRRRDEENMVVFVLIV
jgi:hypothetical protein